MEDDLDEIEDNKEEEISDNKWNINNDKEYNYWKNYILKYYIYLSDNCPICEEKKFSIVDLKNVMNPLRFVCNNNKCLYICRLRNFF